MLTYPKYAPLSSPRLSQKSSNHIQFHSFYYYNEIVYLFRMSLSPLTPLTPLPPLSSLLMRMRLFVDLLQLCYAVVGVALCSAERGVAHQLLYIAHIGLLVEQMGGEGVSQHVR